MNYAKILNAVVILGVINMCAMNPKEATSQDGTKTAAIVASRTIEVRNAQTCAILKTFSTHHHSWFTSVKFKDDNTLSVYVEGGISADDVCGKTVEYALTH